MDINQDILKNIKEVALHNDAQAFRKVYDHYYSRLFSQALYYLNNNPNYAQEVVSDVFVALWQSRSVLDKVSNPDPYLFIALKHAASKYIEKNYRNQTELLTENLPESQSSTHFSDSEIVDQELQEKYKTALTKLPPRCFEVFRLVREERKKYSEVAEMLGISVKTVENQMSKAIKILYEELKENLFSVFF